MATKLDYLVKTMRDLTCAQKAGARFFTIRELMARCNASQQSVYKAIEQLKRDGLLEVQPGGELYVTSKLSERQYLRRPSILVALPRWTSIETDKIKSLIEEKGRNFHSHRLEPVEFDPLRALPRDLPIEREKAIGAVILASGAMLTSDDITGMNEFQKRISLAVIGQHLEDFNIPSVGVDDVYAANLAVNHLIRSGHRKIAILYSEPHSRVMELRCRNAVNYARLHDLDVEVIDCRIAPGELALSKAYDKGRELVRRGFDFTAMLGLSGESMLGAVDALLQGGVSVPEELSLVAIAGIELTSRFRLPVDTVDILLQEQFMIALEMVCPTIVASDSSVIRSKLAVFGSVKNNIMKGMCHA